MLVEEKKDLVFTRANIGKVLEVFRIIIVAFFILCHNTKFNWISNMNRLSFNSIHCQYNTYKKKLITLKTSIILDITLRSFQASGNTGPIRIIRRTRYRRVHDSITVLNDRDRGGAFMMIVILFGNGCA